MDNIKAGVIGYPISHSLSPVIHSYWIEKHGLKGSYQAIKIEPEDLAQDIEAMAKKGYSGFNVTLPFKQDVMALCESVDVTAKAIGAVNTIKILEDGALLGMNTDAFGFIQNLQDQLPDFMFNGASVLVLGAGGAARAVLYGLMSEGVDSITISNRTKDKAVALAGEFNSLPELDTVIDVVDWEERDKTLEPCDLVVNTTSLGMKGQPPLDFSCEGLREDAVVYDIVYAPLYTDILKAAKTKGCRVVTGLGMLLHQARPAFQQWFGVMPDVDDELNALVLDRVD